MFIRKNRNHVEIFTDRHRTTKLASWRISGRAIPAAMRSRFTDRELDRIHEVLIRYTCTGYPEVTRDDQRRIRAADFAAGADWYCSSVRWGHVLPEEVPILLIATVRLLSAFNICGIPLPKSRPCRRPASVESLKP